MDDSIKVGIAGSGTAGPAVAAFLAKAGHEVTLFERAPQKQAVGAGLLMQPTGMAVLERLGILTSLLSQTAKIDHLFCRTTSGTTLLDLPYNELKNGLFGAGTYRPVLLDLLLECAQNAGTKVQWDSEITTLDQKNLIDTHGNKHGPFDLILICDGAKSALRAQTGIPAQVNHYPWGALWFIGKRTPEFAPHTLWQAVEGTNWLNGYLPTGTAQDFLSLFWSIRMREVEEWRSRPLQSWKDHVCRITPQAEPFLQQVESIHQLQTAAYYDVRMKQWHHKNIAILGDAAHALSPQLGQGANLALMDAATLADCLHEYPLEQALRQYSKRRQKHLRFYQFATRWTTPFFQSDSKLLGLARDFGFPVAMTLPWMRRQMIATMAGVKTGPFCSIPL